MIAITHWSLLFYVHWDSVDRLDSFLLGDGAGSGVGWWGGIVSGIKASSSSGMDRIREIAVISFLAKAKRLL